MTFDPVPYDSVPHLWPLTLYPGQYPTLVTFEPLPWTVSHISDLWPCTLWQCPTLVTFDPVLYDSVTHWWPLILYPLTVSHIGDLWPCTLWQCPTLVTFEPVPYDSVPHWWPLTLYRLAVSHLWLCAFRLSSATVGEMCVIALEADREDLAL